MFRETREEAANLVRKALDLLDSSIDKSMDLLHVIDELTEAYQHLSSLEAEGE